jgi:hypothetical protein
MKAATKKIKALRIRLRRPFKKLGIALQITQRRIIPRLRDVKCKATPE